MSDLLSQIVGDQSSRWHAQFLDSLPVGVYRSTVEGRFVFCNKTLAKILGYASAKELLEVPIIRLYQNIQDRGKFIQEIIKSAHAKSYGLALKNKDGTSVDVTVTSGAVFDDEGLLVFIDGIVQQIAIEGEDGSRDLSEQDSAQDEEDVDQSTMKKFEGAKEMAGGISHRLNQPLTIVNNILGEILSDFDNTKENYRKILKVQEQMYKINDIAKKIGNIKKYEAVDYVAGIKIVDIDKAV
jgi:PAS domain S-box-containing protein